MESSRPLSRSESLAALRSSHFDGLEEVDDTPLWAQTSYLRPSSSAGGFRRGKRVASRGGRSSSASKKSSMHKRPRTSGGSTTLRREFAAMHGQGANRSDPPVPTSLNSTLGLAAFQPTAYSSEAKERTSDYKMEAMYTQRAALPPLLSTFAADSVLSSYNLSELLALANKAVLEPTHGLPSFDLNVIESQEREAKKRAISDRVKELRFRVPMETMGESLVRANGGNGTNSKVRYDRRMKASGFNLADLFPKGKRELMKRGRERGEEKKFDVLQVRSGRHRSDEDLREERKTRVGARSEATVRHEQLLCDSFRPSLRISLSLSLSRR